MPGTTSEKIYLPSYGYTTQAEIDALHSCEILPQEPTKEDKAKGIKYYVGSKDKRGKIKEKPPSVWE